MAIPNSAANPVPACAASAIVLAEIDEALAGNRSSGLYVIPSTDATMAAIPQWQADPAGISVVAPSVPGTLSPLELLANLQSGKTSPSRVVIVFSDQMASAVHAPLLVEYGGRTLFLSAMEAVAHVRYGCPVQAWIEGTFSAVRADSDTPEVLRVLMRHLASCHTLGDVWRMRESQSMRSAATRMLHMRRQIQMFHSSLLYAFRDSPLPDEYATIAKKIDVIQKRAATLPRG